jgi:hypothetical protein
VNPKSFHIEELDYGLTEVKNWNSNNSEPSIWTMSAYRHRDLLLDIYTSFMIPNFHRRKASGELLPMTHYLKVTGDTSVVGPSEVFSNRSKDGVTLFNKQRWYGSSPKPLVPRNLLFRSWKQQEMYDILENLGVNPQIFVDAAASKIYSRGWDALTFVAEWRQVVRLFTGALYQFARIVDDYMRLFSKRPSPTTLLPTFDAWLQGRYGWRILVYDIKDITNVILEAEAQQRTRFKERTGTSQKYTRNDSFSNTFTTYREDISDVTEFELGVRGSVITDFVPDKITINPVVTAWELVPYSFVIDWFVSVGTALNALSFLVLNDQYTASIGYHLSATRKVSVSTEAVNGFTIVADNLGQFKLTENWEVNQRRPVRISSTPHIRLNLNELKVTDLMALLAQLLYRLSRR